MLNRRKQSLYIAILMLFLCAITWIVFAFATFLPSDLSNPESEGWMINEALSVTALVVNTIVGFAAVAALFYAAEQAKEAAEQTAAANNSRQVDIFLEVTSRLNTEPLKSSVSQMAALFHLHRSSGDGRSLGRFAHDEVFEKQSRMRFSDVSIADGRFRHFPYNDPPAKIYEYRRSMEVMSFLEDMGVLVMRKHLNEVDLLELLHIHIVTAGEVFGEHLNVLRREGDTADYAHAIFLIDRARAYGPRLFRYETADWPGQPAADKPSRRKTSQPGYDFGSAPHLRGQATGAC